jgi:hypothetical protein
MESEHKIYHKIERWGQSAIYAIADGIGFCVAEIRFTVLPLISNAVNSIKIKTDLEPEDKSYDTSDIKKDPTLPSRTKEKPARPAKATVEASGTVFQPQSTTPPRKLKKYNYWWALARIEQLKKSGVSDPVGYFNNEMSDWWLAPDGMMEKDADFEGIARAIEEHWDQ